MGGGSYDPAFSDNRRLTLHRWVPWIAGYSARFVDEAMETYLRSARPARVLDPFGGVGTTLVEAALHGHGAVGYEINPYAALAARTKLAALQADPQEVRKAVAAYLAAMRAGGKLKRTPPKGFRSRIPFFSPRVERKVLLTLDFMDGLSDPFMADLFRVAMGATLVSVSNYTYEPSLSSRPGAGKPLIENADVFGEVAGKLFQMAEDIELLRAGGRTFGMGVVHTGDFKKAAASERAGSFDIAITSPPYLNNYHYVRNTRPQLWWLGLVDGSEDLARLEEENIGKFWQTVRDQPRVELDFESEPLEDLLSTLRKVRTDKGVYGGAGWANYAAAYFNDTRAYLEVLLRVLKPGGAAVIVIGNSLIQGVNVKVDRILADIAEDIGFSKVAIDCLREKRVGNSITASSVRHGNGCGSLYEAAVVLAKEPCATATVSSLNSARRSTHN